MGKWMLSLLCLAGAALGQPSAMVAVLAGFEARPAPGVFQAMQAELSELFAPAGTSLEWHALETANYLGQPDAVVVVQFTGACAWDWLRPARPVTGVLAWTALVDGELQPLISVDCSRIAAFAGAPNVALLGRALARVLAHELYHYLTQQTAHTHTILFGPSFRARDLLEPELGFDASELAALKAAMGRSRALPVKLTAS